MLEDNFSDNIRQARVIMKYEFRKYLEGKRILIFGALMALVLFLSIALPYIIGDGLSNDPVQLAYSIVTSAPFLVIISATLFVSGTIVSEFEERTALILLTKPLRKWSVFLGKITAACILGFAFMLIYYAVITVVSMVVAGSVASGLLVSMGLALMYTLAATGVAVMISSIVKKASTAAIFTFVLLLMIFTIISGILSMNSIDSWFMLDQASDAIILCLSEEGCDALRSAGVMLVWGVATGMLGYLAFRKREL